MQPHLDGNYTAFGRVTDGMDVVDRLRVNDRIGKAWVKATGDE
jgi:peptidylprolyl isomerase